MLCLCFVGISLNCFMKTMLCLGVCLFVVFLPFGQVDHEIPDKYDTDTARTDYGGAERNIGECGNYTRDVSKKQHPTHEVRKTSRTFEVNLGDSTDTRTAIVCRGSDQHVVRSLIASTIRLSTRKTRKRLWIFQTFRTFFVRHDMNWG